MASNEKNERHDISGETFGKWRVLHYSRTIRYTQKNGKPYWRAFWKCRCSCGTEREVIGHALKTGCSKSCGCDHPGRRLIDLEGNIYGRLLVIDMSDRTETGDHKKTYWECKCYCGKEVVVEGYNLTSGWTRSCGCLRLKKRSIRGLKPKEMPEPNPELWEEV